MNQHSLVLASASPRRKQLLSQIGVSADVRPQHIDEAVQAGETPENYVERVAKTKASAALKTSLDGEVVLAADTTVVVGKQILGKPEDLNDAKRMLNLLSDAEHSVLTAVVVGNSREQLFHLVETKVFFSALNLGQIETYWHSGEPQGKAGAYAIQGLAATFVKGIQGSYSNVVGLPLYETAELLAQFGIKVWSSED